MACLAYGSFILKTAEYDIIIFLVLRDHGVYMYVVYI